MRAGSIVTALQVGQGVGDQNTVQNAQPLPSSPAAAILALKIKTDDECILRRELGSIGTGRWEHHAHQLIHMPVLALVLRAFLGLAQGCGV